MKKNISSTSKGIKQTKKEGGPTLASLEEGPRRLRMIFKGLGTFPPLVSMY